MNVSIVLAVILTLLLAPFTVDAIAAPCSVGGPTSITRKGPDDFNITTVTPCAAAFITTASTVGGADWIMSALMTANFDNAHG